MIAEKTPIILKDPNMKEKIIPKRVDINNLLSRVREEEKKSAHKALVFSGLMGALILFVGLLLSF